MSATYYVINRDVVGKERIKASFNIDDSPEALAEAHEYIIGTSLCIVYDEEAIELEGLKADKRRKSTPHRIKEYMDPWLTAFHSMIDEGYTESIARREVTKRYGARL